MQWIQIVGWLGTTLALLAYFLVSRNYVDGQSPVFQWMNLLGAIGLFIYAFTEGSWPFVVIEICWGGVALFTLVRRGSKPRQLHFLDC